MRKRRKRIKMTRRKGVQDELNKLFLECRDAVNRAVQKKKISGVRTRGKKVVWMTMTKKRERRRCGTHHASVYGCLEGKMRKKKWN